MIYSGLGLRLYVSLLEKCSKIINFIRKNESMGCVNLSPLKAPKIVG